MIRRRSTAAGERWRKFEPPLTQASARARAWFLVFCCLAGAELALARTFTPSLEDTVTLDTLLELWRARDDLYAQRRNELSAEAIESVRTWRQHEAEELPSILDTSRATREARLWVPPIRVR